LISPRSKVMKISGLCLLVDVVVLVFAGLSKFGPAPYLSPSTVSMLSMLAVAVSCLGTLELKIHRRTRSAQHRTANTLASALRNGALR
jgi:hypothetical protein